MKIIFIILSLLFFLHTLRDYFQYKGINNILTHRIPWFWNNPKYELHGLIISVILGFLFLLFGVIQ